MKVTALAKLFEITLDSIENIILFVLNPQLLLIYHLSKLIMIQKNTSIMPLSGHCPLYRITHNTGKRLDSTSALKERYAYLILLQTLPSATSCLISLKRRPSYSTSLQFLIVHLSDESIH